MGSTSLCSKDTDTSIVDIQYVMDRFESDYYTARQIAMLRIHLLCHNYYQDKQSAMLPSTCRGLAATFLPVFKKSVEKFVHLVINYNNQDCQLQRCHERRDDSDVELVNAHRHLCRVLGIYRRWAQKDSTLSEELVRQGSHLLLIQLLQLTMQSQYKQLVENENVINEQITDLVVDYVEEVQDLVGEIAASSRPRFPLTTTDPLTTNELIERLPLIFHFHRTTTASAELSDETSSTYGALQSTLSVETIDQIGEVVTVLVNQIKIRQSAQIDVGFVTWPSAVVLSSLIVKENWITDFYATNTSVLEIGAGCGLSGLTATLLLQKHNNTSMNGLNKVRVVLTDFNSVVLENLQQNVELNDLTDICSVVGLDFYEQTGSSANHWIAMDGTKFEPVDLVLGADIICEPADAVAVANTLHDVLNPNGIAYIVCADPKHRFGVDCLQVECQRVGLLITTTAITCSESNDRRDDTIKLTQHDLLNLALTSGFVESMNLTLFVIRKFQSAND